MIELKKKIDEIVNETVATAYFNKEHEFLYLRPDTLANFAGLRFKEEGEEFFYAPKDKEEWKSVARIQVSAKEAAQSKIISTFNLPVNFDGGLSWYRSYFSDYDDKQIINYLKYQQLNKRQISSKRLNKKQKDLITYFCEAPHFEALLTKGYRFQCVLEDMEKKILRSFPITKQDCQ